MERLGRYVLVRRLALGRTTEILLARREEAGGFARDVAIKAMTARLAGAGDAVRGFLQETRITAMLHHPNLVQAYDVDEHRGRYYMVLEHIPGRSLRAVMSTQALRRVPMSVDIAMEIVRAAAAGIAHAHARGVLHRDITPSNVMIGEDGFVKVIDFGGAVCERFELSRAQRADVASRYSAPELVRNDPIDGRADVYSLGALLFELTTGAELFVGDEPVRRIAAGLIPKPSTLRRGYPAALEELVTRALAHARERRFESALTLQGALEKLAVANRVPLSSRRVAEFVRGLFETTPDRTPATSVARNTGKTRVRVTRRRRAAAR